MLFADMLAASIETMVGEVRVGEELTHATVEAFVGAVREALAARPSALWLNLEEVKLADVAGLAGLVQAVERAAAAGIGSAVFPSPLVYRALFAAGLPGQLTLDKRRPGDRSAPAISVEVLPAAPASPVGTARIELRPPTWDDLMLLEGWAQDPLLDEMVGSDFLAMCRHLGPYHSDFVGEAVTSPTALTFLIHPRVAGAAPVGFVRIYGVNVEQRFAFIETAVAHRRGRVAWGIEATRLAAWYAVERLGIRRLETKAFAYNMPSVNALERNGFVREGVLREARVHAGRRWDILVFAMLESEIRAALARDGFAPLGLWPT